MRVVFKTYPQDSHYNATFPLAQGLKKLGCEVIYAGDEDRRDPIIAQGFSFHPEETDLLPKMVPGAVQGDPPSAFETVREMISSWSRRAQGISSRIPADGFDELVRELRPDAMLVDSPYARFSLALFKHRIPFGVTESMVRLDYRSGIAPPSEEVVPTGSFLCRFRCDVLWHRYWTKTRIFQWIGWHVVPSRAAVRAVLAAAGTPRVRVDFRRYFHIGVTSVPEFILPPEEFDFPSPRKANQHYVGPSVDLERAETGYDYTYFARIEPWLRRRAEAGVPIVYCSLGTASWRYAGIEKFFRRVIAASDGQPWNLVIALAGELEPRMFRPLPPNVLIFQKVPQIHILKHADAAITHGGMNSVAEAILLGVPQLVFPGTRELDQPGNAARVVYHRIGLKGHLRRDSTALIRTKIARVLQEPEFRSRVRDLSARIRNSRAYREGAKIVLELLTSGHAPVPR